MIAADDGWASVACRVALGFVTIPVLRFEVGEGATFWADLAALLSVLLALRLVPAVLRKVLPFSAQAKEVWRERRQLAKRFDSYQWKKLLWLGLGMSVHPLVGSRLSMAETMLMIVCLTVGLMGVVAWKRVEGQHRALLDRA